jgi:hypothetical protein
MSDYLSESLAVRVERLERECARLSQSNSRWKKIAAAVFMGSVALLISGAEAGKVIEAERFVLNNGGHVRAVLETDKKFGPKLAFFDEDGQEAIILGFNGVAGPALFLESRKGSSTVVIAANNFGASHVDLSVDNGRMLSLLTTGGDDSSAQVIMGKKDGPGRLSLTENNTGAWIGFSPLENQVDQGLTVGVGEDGAMDFTLLDKNNKKRKASAVFSNPSRQRW